MSKTPTDMADTGGVDAAEEKERTAGAKHFHKWFIDSPSGSPYSWGRCKTCDVEPRQFSNVAQVDFNPLWVRSRKGLDAMNSKKGSALGRKT